MNKAYSRIHASISICSKAPMHIRLRIAMSCKQLSIRRIEWATVGIR